MLKFYSPIGEGRTRGPGVVVGPEKNKGGGTPVKNAEKL